MSHHPSETELALLAGNDCSGLRRYFLSRHVSRCGDCRDTVASFHELRSATRDHAAPSDDLDWNRLAAEMRANIRVGLAAGECVREVPARSRFGWRPQLAIGTVCVLFLAGAGVFLHGLLPGDNEPTVVHAAQLESTSSGVEVRTATGSMTLMNHGGVAGDQSVTSDGAIRASYVDGDTGTVTVTSVYVE
jgi:hypothetical protein